FKGSNPNGIWSLYVMADDAHGSGGMDGGWSLTIATIDSIADLSLGGIGPPDPVAVGSNITYILSMTNAGPAPATGVMLQDALPPNVSVTSVLFSQGSCTNAGANINCNLGT